MSKKPIFLVADNDGGMRLDNFILKQRRQMDKSTLYKLIRKGQVRINGKRCKPDNKVLEGDQVRVPPFLFFVDEKSFDIPESFIETIKNRVVFHDDDCLLIDKPAGLPCHVGSGHDFGVIEVVQHGLGFEHAQLAHRLDKATSGCLLVALRRQFLLAFQEQMQLNQVEKVYQAIVEGVVSDSFTVNESLDVAHRLNGIRHVVVDSKGKSATSHFEPMNVFTHDGHEFTRVQCRIEQGRTHQIRVHAAHAGHPVWGDLQYGARLKHQHRSLCLHAESLSFKGHHWQVDCPF